MSNLKIMVTKLEKWTWIFMQLSVIDKYCHLLTSLLTVYNWFWKSGNRHLVLLRLYLLEIFLFKCAHAVVYFETVYRYHKQFCS